MRYLAYWIARRIALVREAWFAGWNVFYTGNRPEHKPWRRG